MAEQIVLPSNDVSGNSDYTAIQAVLSAGNTAVLSSSATYYDNGTAFTWLSSSRVRSSDHRPFFVEKGTSATSMTALPNSITKTNATLTMRLPPAANWAEQIITCMCSGSNVITVDPNGTEEMDQMSTYSLSTNGSRLVLKSDGASPIRILADGDHDVGSIYVGQIKGTTRAGDNGEIVLRPSPRDGAGARELSGVSVILGDLVPASGYKGGYIVGKDLDGNMLFDWQIFGSGSPTGFMYWREAYNSIGWRVQMLSPVAGEGFVVESYNGADVQFDMGNSGASGHFYVSGGGKFIIDATGDGKLAFFSATPQAKQTVTGSKGGNAALASLITALANYGLIVDSTT